MFCDLEVTNESAPCVGKNVLYKHCENGVSLRSWRFFLVGFPFLVRGVRDSAARKLNRGQQNKITTKNRHRPRLKRGEFQPCHCGPSLPYLSLYVPKWMLTAPPYLPHWALSFVFVFRLRVQLYPHLPPHPKWPAQLFHRRKKRNLKIWRRYEYMEFI